MHEDVEGNGNTVGRYAVGRDGPLEIALAAMVFVLGPVELDEHLARTWRKREVVAADIILHDGEHRVRAVGIENVVRGEEDAAGIVDRAAGGDVLVRVVRIVGDEV